MSPDFNEDSEKASLHPGSEEFDDTSQYVTVRGVTEKGVLPSLSQLEPTVISPLESVRMAMGQECDSESFRQAVVNLALPEEPPPEPPPTLQHLPPVVSWR